MSEFSLVIYLCGLAIAFIVNRDVLSPVKLFMALLAFFSMDLFIHDYPVYIHAVFIGYVITAVICLQFERPLPPRPLLKNSRINDRDISAAVRVLWLLTLIPVAAQLYLLHMNGGIQGYILSSSDRVQLYKGLGPLLALRDSIRALNLFYWCICLAGRVRRKDFLLFGAHFSISLLMSLGTASRGSFLWPLIFMTIAYGIFKRRVPIKSVVIVVLTVIPAVSILSAVRDNIGENEQGKINLKTSDRKSFLQTTYAADALVPLALVLPDQNINLKYGETFATVITNFVPRSLWPDKPDSGGVVITKEYLGNGWLGMSYITTGIIAESVMNFGHVFGIIFGYGFLFLALRATSREYHRLRFKPLPVYMKLDYVARAVFFIFAMETVASMQVAEFTNGFWSLLVNGLWVYGALQAMGWYKVVADPDKHRLRVATPAVRARLVARGR